MSCYIFKCLPKRKEHLFSSLKTMTYQLESFWLEYTPQFEKETKRFKNHIVETTLLFVDFENNPKQKGVCSCWWKMISLWETFANVFTFFCQMFWRWNKSCSTRTSFWKNNNIFRIFTWLNNMAPLYHAIINHKPFL